MNCLEAAQNFNARCPKGSAVAVTLRTGERKVMKTTGLAFIWANVALVELEGGSGPYQVEFLSPVDEHSRAQKVA
jgi:hypothetical protein